MQLGKNMYYGSPRSDKILVTSDL